MEHENSISKKKEEEPVSWTDSIYCYFLPLLMSRTRRSRITIAAAAIKAIVVRGKGAPPVVVVVEVAVVVAAFTVTRTQAHTCHSVECNSSLGHAVPLPSERGADHSGLCHLDGT
jgi:hypothetical protein